MIVKDYLLYIQVLQPSDLVGRTKHREHLQKGRPSSFLRTVCASSLVQLLFGVPGAFAAHSRHISYETFQISAS